MVKSDSHLDKDAWQEHSHMWHQSLEGNTLVPEAKHFACSCAAKLAVTSSGDWLLWFRGEKVLGRIPEWNPPGRFWLIQDAESVGIKDRDSAIVIATRIN